MWYTPVAMGFVPPPPPPTADQLDALWAGGARTFAELDPALERWRLRIDRMHRFQAACLAAGFVVMILGVIVLAAVPFLADA